MCVVVFLTSNAALVSAVGENRLQLCETCPGLDSAGQAFQILHIKSWTEDKETNTTQTHVSVCVQTSVRTYIKCVTSPLVSVAEVWPKFRQPLQVNTLWRIVDKLTPSATTTEGL